MSLGGQRPNDSEETDCLYKLSYQTLKSILFGSLPLWVTPAPIGKWDVALYVT